MKLIRTLPLMICVAASSCVNPFFPPEDNDQEIAYFNENAALLQQINVLQEQLLDSQSQSESFQRMLAEAEEAKEREQQALRDSLKDAEGVEIGVNDAGQQIIRMDATLIFPSGRHTLTKAGRVSLEKVAKALKAEKLLGRGISVQGHTDSDKIKASKERYSDNWDLSAKRSHSVLIALEKAGITSSRLHGEFYGSMNPVKGIPGKTKIEKAKDRRVEITILD
jgi:chemotaxis protein MotB